MSNLSNQQINQSFTGLLQIPGGVTSVLQTVQDGNGNPTGLQLSSAGASVTTSDTFAVSVNGTQITGAIPRLISDGFGDALNAKDFGIVGDGSDETTEIQAALNAASGKTLLFEAGKIYGYTQLTVKNNSIILTFGSTFNRLSASTTYGFIVEAGVKADVINITTPGGASGDNAMWIQGSNVALDRVSISATAQGVYNSANNALLIGSTPTGSMLSNITISSFYCVNFTNGIAALYVSFFNLSNALIEYYRRGIYLKDASYSRVDNATCRYTASTCRGAPGENGVLLEARISDTASRNIYFTNCSMQNSGEHAYRLGGLYTIQNVWFSNCSAIKPGSAIVINNPAATEWHGGCGFKVLGNPDAIGHKHKNVFFNDCLVEDINDQFGSFPLGHGAGNFSGFQVAVASNVYISNCSVKKNANSTYSCGYGIEILAADHVYFENVQIEDMYSFVRLYEAPIDPAYPGWALPYEYIYFKNCFFNTANSGNVLVVGDDYQNQNNHDIYLIQCHLSGGARATRVEPVTGTGSYSKVYFDFTYTDCTENPAVATIPICWGAGGNDIVVANVRGPWHPNAYGPQLGNASFWQDTYAGNLYTRDVNWYLILNKTQLQNSATAIALASAANAINTEYKISGTMVFNSTNRKLYRALGSATTDIWEAVDGSATITPV